MSLLDEENLKSYEKIRELQEEVERQKRLRMEVIDLDKSKPTMADLMREMLGLTHLNFSDVDKEGVPKHFLDTEKETRKMYISQLAQIQQLDVWQVMIKNHIDTQGNYSFRTADGELQMLAGRMSVNGISLVRDEVKKGYDEYMEGRKPKEEFDEFEVGEGIIINKLDEN